VGLEAAAIMDAAAEKGQRYARIFRKAGTLLGKGEIARAIEAFQEGQALAEQLGDSGWRAALPTKSSAPINWIIPPASQSVSLSRRPIRLPLDYSRFVLSLRGRFGERFESEHPEAD
jgi:hypothetical protein